MTANLKVLVLGVAQKRTISALLSVLDHRVRLRGINHLPKEHSPGLHRAAASVAPRAVSPEYLEPDPV